MPRMKRPTTNCGIVELLATMAVPMMMIIPPVNMVVRRPSLSAMIAAKGAPTIEPLYQDLGQRLSISFL